MREFRLKTSAETRFCSLEDLNQIENTDQSGIQIKLLIFLENLKFNFEADSSYIYGIAMPTKTAIRRVLQKISSGPGGQRRVFWTSLREEPVIYVNGRPYVLRLFPDPLKNLEATGIAKERVESMETQMKCDIQSELRQFGGRVLLHEEHVDGNNFSIVVNLFDLICSLSGRP